MIISFAHVLQKIPNPRSVPGGREKGHTFSLQVKPRHNFRFPWLQRRTVPPYSSGVDARRTKEPSAPSPGA